MAGAGRRAVWVAVVAAVAAAPIPVVLDTDIGTDMDDSFALAYILSRPDVYDLKLVQCSTYNTTQRALMATKFLTDVGRADIPVAVGEYTGEQTMPLYPIAADFSFSQYLAAGGNLTDGTTVLQSLMAAATPQAPLYILEIAPATSLGHVLLSNPALAANCIVVAMSGSIDRGYDNSSVPDAEYNVVRDIPASQAVYNASWLSPMVTAPLDTTIFDQFNGATYTIFLQANASGRVLASTLMANYQVWYDNGGRHYGALLPFSPATGTSTMYDVQAAWQMGWYVRAGGQQAAATAPPTFPNIISQPLPLVVNSTGYTVSAPGMGKTVYAATAFTAKSSPYISVAAIGADVFTSIAAAP